MRFHVTLGSGVISKLLRRFERIVWPWTHLIKIYIISSTTSAGSNKCKHITPPSKHFLCLDITLSCPCNEYQYKPTLSPEKWGLQGWTFTSLVLFKNRECKYSLEPLPWGGANNTHNLWTKNKKNITIFHLKNIRFDPMKRYNILHRHVNVMPLGESTVSSYKIRCVDFWSFWGCCRTSPIE